jgi:rhodanese-related sulfurtransferase
MSSNDAFSSIESVRKVSHILLPQDQSTLLNTLKSQLDSNLSLFPQLAAQHSTCPSKRAKGDIGWVSPGTTVQEFEQAAFAAPLNTPVTCESPFGLHIILVTQEKKQYKVVQLTPQQVQEMIEASSLASEGDQDDDRLQLVDVREDWEFSTASVPGFQLFPITQMVGGWGNKVGEGEEGVVLDSSRPTICMCHHGVRSNQAAQWLANTKGFSQVYNMIGGIDAYSRAVDPNIPRY